MLIGQYTKSLAIRRKFTNHTKDVSSKTHSFNKLTKQNCINTASNKAPKDLFENLQVISNRRVEAPNKDSFEKTKVCTFGRNPFCPCEKLFSFMS